MKVLIVTITVALLVSVLIPVATADNDGLHVILTGDDQTYGPGDEATVKVHVFHDGERVDPDDPPVLDFETYSSDEGREITTAKKGTGLYEGKFKIFDSDVEDDSNGYVGLRNQYKDDDDDYSYYGSYGHALQYGKADENDITYDYIESYDTNSVSVMLKGKEGLEITYKVNEAPNRPWSPGDIVEFMVFIKEDGELVKPDEMEIFEMGSYWDDDSNDVPYNNPSVGTYEAQFTIPSSTKEDKDFLIYMAAEKDDIEAYNYFSISVDMFCVWFHDLTSSSTLDRQFEIFVADMSGQPVSGAEITIDYYDPGYEYSWDRRTRDSDVSESPYKEISQTTGTTGSAKFSISGVDQEVDIDGMVKFGGLTQDFDGELYYMTEGGQYELDPSSYEFDVETKSHTYIESGGKATHELYAFFDGEPVVGGQIFYYVYDEYDILGTGSMTTAAEGRFMIEFDRPSSDGPARVELELVQGYHPGVFEGYDWEDSDYDGFSDKYEKHIGTDPNDRDDYPSGYQDSDGDEFGDAYELHKGTDPEDYSDYPNDFLDSDGDGFGDEFEDNEGTDPDYSWDYPDRYPDNDTDGHSDAHENYYGTDPDEPDDYPHNSYETNSDGDEVDSGSWWYSSDEQFDDEEIFYGTDPNDPNDYPKDIYDEDSDYDGVCDEEEKWYGTDPESYSDDPSIEPSPWDDRYSDHNSTNGMRYFEDGITLSADSELKDVLDDTEIKLKVSNFKIGGSSKIKVSGDGPTIMAGSAWYFGGIDSLNDAMTLENGLAYNLEWECWTESGIDLYDRGDSYEGSILAPSFLPSGGQKYTVLAVGINEKNEMFYTYVEIKNGQTATSYDEGLDILGVDDGNLPIIIAVVVLIIVAVIMAIIFIALILVLVRKKKGDKEQKPQQGVDGKPLPPPPPQQTSSAPAGNGDQKYQRPVTALPPASSSTGAPQGAHHSETASPATGTTAVQATPQATAYKAASTQNIGSSTPAMDCPKCGAQSAYYEKYSAYYCITCRDYFVEGTELDSEDEAPSANYQDMYVYCSSCQKPATFITQNSSYYCYNCKGYLDKDGKLHAPKQGSCSTCGGATTYYEQYQTWWCPSCQKYV